MMPHSLPPALPPQSQIAAHPVQSLTTTPMPSAFPTPPPHTDQSLARNGTTQPMSNTTHPNPYTHTNPTHITA